MKQWLYLFLLIALTGCDFGENKIFESVVGGTPKRFFTASSVTVAEGDTAVFTVSFNSSSTTEMTVPYATSSGTATSGTDFTAASGTLTFAPGETSKTISVVTIDDPLIEGPETFQLAFGSGSGYETGSSTALVLGTITDNDVPKTIHAYSSSNVEGSPLQFNVILSGASSFPVMVAYATTDGSATTADSDYTAASGTLTFAPGETSKSVTVNTTADTTYENDETLTFSLSGGYNYVAAGSTLSATGTIVNDDTRPTIYFANAAANEGSSVDFTVSLSNKSFETVTVNYTTADITAGSIDYTPASGTLTFAPGEISKTISVATTADTTYEPDETFSLTLSGGANYITAGSTLAGTGTITNDDAQPTVAISAANATEGSSLSFTVSLPRPSYQTITVNYATSDGTATLADSDYTAASGTLTFSPGQTSKTFTVASTADTKFEADETFTVTLSGGSNYASTGSTLTAIGTINNDDSAPIVAVSNATATEGSALTFTVALSTASYQTVTIDYATSDGTATVADLDYTAASGTLTFSPGQTSKTFTVNSTNDAYYEPNETFTVTLSGGSNYATSGSTLSGVGTITNDDTRPTIAEAAASATEGSNVDFTVQLSHRTDESVTINYATSAGTATSGTDFTAASGTLTFAAGETSKTVTVATTQDAIFEANETFTLTLSGGSNYTSAGSTLSATGTINNDDTAPTVLIAAASATEGSALTFTVALSNTSYQTVTLNYATSDGTATTADSDYTAASGTLSFSPGDTTKTFTVSTTTDSKYEADETFTATLSGGSNYTASGSTLSATGTITNDDTAPTIAVNNASATEGSALTFTVTLSAASYQAVTVDYATSDGTATTADSDYTATTGTLTFTAGQTSKTFTVSSTSDGDYEPNETFGVTLSGGSNYTTTGSTLTGTGTITNDDARPTISVAAASATEGSNIDFTVQLAQRTFESVTINYATSGGTATSGTDFTAASGSLTFAPGETNKTISVATTQDDILEANETFTLTLSGGSNYTATGSTLTATGTINNDDTAPTILLSDTSATEGSALIFTATLSNASYQTVTVNYATSNGTATTADSDYTAASGTLTFAPGDLTKTFTVNTTADSKYEADETLTATLSAGSNYTSTGSTLTATGTITNDDSAPTLTVNNASATEGSALTFTVTLSAASYQTVTVDYATSDGTATTTDSDYTATTGSLTFTAGQTSKTFTVNTTADTNYEPNETFGVTLSGGANYTTTGSTLSGTGTITNDDTKPTISVAASSATEGSTVDFTVTLASRSFEAVTINYATSSGTAASSTDFTAASGTLTFAAGETSKTISVATIQDTILEANETFTLTLSGGSNYTSTGSTLTATGTINNDDTAPTITITDASATEGGAITFTASLSNESYQTVTVNYATSDGTATTSDSDYTAASGTLTFAPGDTSKNFTVSTTADNKFEANETFTVTLSAGANYTSTGSTLTATGTILNDDTAPTIAVNNASATEGNALTFTATLSSPSYQTVTVDYATSDGTALTSDSDYTAASGTLTFTAGQTTKTFTVNTTADTYYEANETFAVTLSGGANYNSVGSTLAGTGTITNDDTRPTISVAAASASEGSSVDFTVELSHRSFETITVAFATSGGTATSGTDFTAASGTLTFSAGETSKIISVATIQDNILEANETFTLTLSGGGNYTSTGSTLSATGTINNDDTAPTISIADASASEGGTLTFTATLSNASYQTITVGYATSDGTATTADSDYTAVSGTLTFSPGDTTKSFTVSSTADTKFEANETFTATLSGGANYTVTGSTLTATGTINNDDSAPTLSVAAASATEGSSVDFTVTLGSASYQTVTVSYATSDGTATTADSDYANTTGTLTFSPGDLTKTISVNTTSDTKYEADETFTLTLSGGGNYSTTGSTLAATGTITNDDAQPAISIADASGNEGDYVVFTVTQDRASSANTTFHYATSTGTADSSDFTAASGTGTITAGATSTTISVAALDDALDEPDEDFTISLSSASNATIGTASATGTIVDTTLLFNFMGGSLPGGTSFSRATAATYVNSAGSISSAANDSPRFDYDPATGTLKGLLVEPGSANLITYSAALENTNWNKTGLGLVTANSADSASPDGISTNAEFVHEDGILSTHQISQSLGGAVNAGTLLHFTVYAKADAASPRNYLRLHVGSGANEMYANFDLTGANAPTTSSRGDGGGQLSASVQNAGNGWQRLRLSGVASSSATNLSVTINLQNLFDGPEIYLGNSSGGVNLWGAQLEAGGSVPTSYIPTTYSAASRSADMLTATSFTGFSGNYGDGSKWTTITDFSRPYFEPTTSRATPAASTLCVEENCENYGISSIFDSAAGRMGSESLISGAVQGRSYSANLSATAGKVYQVGSVKNGRALTTYVNGTGSTASGALSFPTVDTLYLGRNLAGHIRKFTLRPRAVGAKAMSGLTAN